MSDNGDEPEPQPRIYMRTSAANGFDGNEVEVTVEGRPDDDLDDLAEVARERFDHAVECTGTYESDRPGYQ